MRQSDPDGMLCHIVRLQEEGLDIQEIEGWFARYGIQDLDVHALALRAETLPQAQRSEMVSQSKRVVRQMSVGIAFGSFVGTFVIAWIFVGVMALLPFVDHLLGGSIAAGLKVGAGVKSMLTERKPIAVFIGGVIGWTLFVVTYVVFIEDISLGDVTKALFLLLISAWYLSRIRVHKGKEGALIVFLILSLVYFGLVFAIVSW